MLRGPVMLLTLCLMSGVAGVAGAQSHDDSRLAPEERAYVASKIYSLIPVFFAHGEGAPNLDLDAAYKQYLAQALATDGRREFDLATLEFVAKLANGHTDFWDPWIIDRYGQLQLFDAHYFDGQWVVTRSSLPGLKPGDIIVSIDGQPFEQFFADNRKYLSGSSESQQRRRLFSSNSPLPRRFSIQLAEGRSIRVEPKAPTAAAKKEPPETTESRWIHEGVLAYIKIPSFDEPELQKSAIEFLRKFQNAKTLIIDVRGNVGGGTPSDLIRSLMDRPWRHWIETTPSNLGTMRAEMNNDPAFHLDYRFEYPSEKPEKPIYSGKLFILVDDDCTSACEDFAMPFKDNGRATIIGESTFGSSGQPYVQRFENGMIFRISTKREYFPNGSEFEGRGIRPNVEVHPRAEDLRSGKDVIFQKAVMLASQD